MVQSAHPYCFPPPSLSSAQHKAQCRSECQPYSNARSTWSTQLEEEREAENIIWSSQLTSLPVFPGPIISVCTNLKEYSKPFNKNRILSEYVALLVGYICIHSLKLTENTIDSSRKKKKTCLKQHSEISTVPLWDALVLLKVNNIDNDGSVFCCVCLPLWTTSWLQQMKEMMWLLLRVWIFFSSKYFWESYSMSQEILEDNPRIQISLRITLVLKPVFRRGIAL